MRARIKIGFEEIMLSWVGTAARSPWHLRIHKGPSWRNAKATAPGGVASREAQSLSLGNWEKGWYICLLRDRRIDLGFLRFCPFPCTVWVMHDHDQINTLPLQEKEEGCRGRKRQATFTQSLPLQQTCFLFFLRPIQLNLYLIQHATSSLPTFLRAKECHRISFW